MPRVLVPSRHVPVHRRHVSAGARGMVLAVCLALFATWFILISREARLVRGEVRDMTARLGRFEARAAAFEAAVLGRQ